MRAILITLKISSRSAVTAFFAMLFVVMFGSGLLGVEAGAQSTQVILNQTNGYIGPLSGGGALSGGNPGGTTMAVNQQGNLITGNTYGSTIFEFNGPANTATTLGSFSNVGPIVVDANNNLLLGNTYSGTIAKIPYVGGSYAAISSTSSSTPPCTGNDTVECYLPISEAGVSGVVSLAVDAAGDLFLGSTNSNSGANAIYEVTAANLYSGSGTASMIYQEPSAAAAAQLNIGGLAVDPYGDVFFTDAVFNPSGSNESTSSNVKELVYTAGTGYAAAPVTIYNFVNASPGNYDDVIDGVATDATGTVYMAGQYDGVFAFPNNHGVVNTAGVYAVTTQGAKAMALDSTGDVYSVTYVGAAGGDAAVYTAVNKINVGSATVGGTAGSVNDVVTILNDGTGCSPAETVAFTATEGGTTTTEFGGSLSGNCGTLAFSGGSQFPTTITFNPTTGGPRTAVLTATDSDGNSGTASVTGTGIGTQTPTFNPPAGTYTSIQTVSINDGTANASIYYTTDGTTPTNASTPYTGPITVASTETIKAIATYSGLANSPVASALYTINATPVATPTFTPMPGTYGSSQLVTISTPTAGATIYYTVNGPTPTTASTQYVTPIAVTSSETIEAIAVLSGYPNSAVATGVYTITISTGAPVPNVLFTQTNGQVGALSGGGALSGLNPAGTSVGVNQQGAMIAGDSYGGSVFLFNGPAGTSAKLGSFGNVGPTLVDNGNNLLIGQIGGTPIAKIPYAAGTYAVASVNGSTPQCTGTDTVECQLPFTTTSAFTNAVSGVVSMAMDAAGNLYYATMGPNPYSGPPSTPAFNAIFECTAACIYSTTTPPTLIYQEPAGTGGQLTLGSIAVGPHGDVFFTDSFIDATGTQQSDSSNLKEMLLTAPGTFAATPITLQTFTPSSPGSYDDEIDGVAVDSLGTVYYTSQNEGVFAMPSSNGVVDTAAVYGYTTQGSKVLALDANKNVYEVAYSNGDVALYTMVNNVTVPAGVVGGPATTANVTMILNDGGCSTPETISFAATENGSPTTEFTAATSGTCGSLAFSSGSDFPATVTFNPTAGGTRSAVLTATDSNGNSGTATVTGTATTTAAQTITFTPPTTPVQYGVAPITLSATASSGLPVTFSVTSGPGTISGDTLTVTGVGTIVVAANQAGNSTYSAAPTVSQSIVVNQGSQTITFTAPASPVQYGVAPITLSATASSGLAVTFSVTSGPGTVSGNTLTVTGVGTIVVAADQAGNADYAAAPTVSQSIVVNGESQTITFTPPTSPVTYGVAPITLSATASSGLAVTFTVTSGPGTISGNTLTVTGAGTIVVAANQAGNADYAAATAVSETIVVNPEAQTITFTAPTSPVAYGVAPITLSATASSGLAVTFSVTSGPGTISGNTLTVTGAGTIVVAANQAGNTNYAAAPTVSQSIVVTPTGVVATPTFTPAGGSYTVNQSVMIADSTTGATIYYTTNGTTPTTASTAYNGTAIAVNGTETIEAIAVETGYTSSAVASATYTIPPGFAIASNESSVQVTYGQTSPVTLTVTSAGGFTGTVSFACSGLPTGATCAFSPATATITATATSATTTLNVSAPATSAQLERKMNPMIPGGATFAAALCLIGFRKRRRLQVVLMVVFGVIGMSVLSGCGSGTPAPPPIVTQTVTVTGTSGSVSNTVTFSLVEE
jgi:hypothetical protein